MKKLTASCALLLLASCGPGADVNSFPTSFADAYCHFIYHCCTPADRANPANPFSFTATEQTFDFANESDCDTKLGAAYQIDAQPTQASVKDQRISYNQTDAQACLNALSNAASACDPNAYLAATTGSSASCNAATFVTGLVAANGNCTLDADCAAAHSVCTPLPQDAGVPVISSAGTCTPPPGVGDPCAGICAAGSCCGAGANGLICMAYVAPGAPCAAGCSATPCDTSKDYCDTAKGCTALVPNGGACVPANFGNECVSGNCDGKTSTCQPFAPTDKLEVCVGNPDGF